MKHDNGPITQGDAVVLWRSLTLAVGVSRVEVEGKLVVSSLQEQQQLHEEDHSWGVTNR